MKKLEQVIVLTALLFSTAGLFGQTVKITGTVADSLTRTPLAGAFVQVENNSALYCYTSNDGSFELIVPDSDETTIQVRYLGYAAVSLIAKPGSHIMIAMLKSTTMLSEIEVTSSGFERSYTNVPAPMVVLKQPFTVTQPFISAPAVLSGQPGIAAISDGVWPAALSIRGLGEQRNIILVDGNRIEASADVAGSLSMIDLYNVKSIQIIKGGSSVRYGTGAMGGIVNIITGAGDFLQSPAVNSTVITEYQTVNRMMAGHIQAGYSSQKLYSGVSYTRRRASDTQTPAGKLKNSSFSDQALGFNVGVKTSKNGYLTFKSQYFEADDVGISGGTPFSANAQVKYKKASRLLLNPQFTAILQNDFFHQFKAGIFYQQIVRNVDVITHNPPKVAGNKRTTVFKLTPEGRHTTIGGNLIANGRIDNIAEWTAGIDVWQRAISTSRERHILIENIDTAGNVLSSFIQYRGEQPIPDARFSSSGIFLTLTRKFFNQKLTIDAGFRADAIFVSNQKALDPVYIRTSSATNFNPVPQRITYNSDQSTEYSWNFEWNAKYEFNSMNSLVMSIVRSYRAASPEERFKYIDLGSYVNIGNPWLNPETGWFNNVGWRFNSSVLQFELNGFTGFIDQMISEKPGIYVFFYNDSLHAGNPDTLPAKVLSNISSACIYGADFKGLLSFPAGFRLTGTGTYVRGINTSENSNLPMISPANAKLVFEWSYRFFNPEVGVKLIAPQNKTATGETATGGAALYFAAVSIGPVYAKNVNFRVNAGTDNLTNRAWRNHLSTNRGVVKLEPGRNFFIRLSVGFN